MNTSETAILDQAFAAAETWAKANGGAATKAADPQHAVDILEAGASGGLHVAVFWESDAEAGEGFPGDTRCNGIVGLALLRPSGLKPRGDETGATLALCSKLRAAVLGAAYEGLLGYPAYAGKSPLTVSPGRLLQGYILRVRFHYAYEFTEES